MDNKLQTSEPQFLQSGTAPTTVNLPGDNNTLIAHADRVTNEYRPLYVFNNQPNGNITAGAVQEFNPDYYNLIVVGDGDLDGTGHFLVDKRRAITESTSQELKDAYASLTPEAVSKIKTFPAIIATENHSYGKTDDQHQAIYGIITDVKVQDNGIKVYYQILNWIPQQSWEFGCQLREVLRPNTERLRYKLRDLYRELHPEEYEGVPPFEDHYEE